jgi:hypothetical protein
MHRIHALFITLIVMVAVTVGGIAVRGARADGTATPAASAVSVIDPQLAAITARSTQLDALEASLDTQLAEASKPIAKPAPRPARVVVVQTASRPSVARHDSDDDGAEDREHEGGGDDD